MRIGLIAPPWVPVPPPAYGGIEAVVHRLACGLVAAGHDVLLAAPQNSTCPVPQVAGLPPAEATRIGATVVELRHLARAYAAMEDVDLVHDHTVAGPLFRNRPPQVPVVTTNHGPFLSELGELYQVMGPDVTVIAISHHQASAAGGVPIARVIHHGIDITEVPPGDGRGGYACFLGRMHPHKGPREAVLVARRAGIPLLLAARMSEPAEREYFDHAVAPLLGRDAEYVGELGEAEKYALLGGAVALLNPIRWPEPFGLVMLEALATGTPVVATPAGAAPEIVDDGTTGYLQSGVTRLAAALVRAAGLDRGACRRVAADRFSTQRMVAEHLTLYGEILDAAPKRSRFRHVRRTRPTPDATRDTG
jgi:glycosyltransferase involved in cell wall biosynthesis